MKKSICIVLAAVAAIAIVSGTCIFLKQKNKVSQDAPTQQVTEENITTDNQSTDKSDTTSFSVLWPTLFTQMTDENNTTEHQVTNKNTLKAVNKKDVENAYKKFFKSSNIEKYHKDVVSTFDPAVLFSYSGYEKITYIDIDKDGIDEAILSVGYDSEYTPGFSISYIFTYDNGNVVLLMSSGQCHGGYRAYEKFIIINDGNTNKIVRYYDDYSHFDKIFVESIYCIDNKKVILQNSFVFQETLIDSDNGNEKWKKQCYSSKKKDLCNKYYDLCDDFNSVIKSDTSITEYPCDDFEKFRNKMTESFKNNFTDNYVLFSAVDLFYSYQYYFDTIKEYKSKRNEFFDSMSDMNITLESFSYCIKDINNDGVDELIIRDDSEYNAENKDNLSAIYTLKDYEIIELYFEVRHGHAYINSDGYIIMEYKGMDVYKLVGSELEKEYSVDNYHKLIGQGVDFEEYCENYKKENGISTENMKFDFIAVS